MKMQKQDVINAQLDFYRQAHAGCLFAAHAARNPHEFGWDLSVDDKVSAESIEGVLRSAISSKNVSTQSVIFPSVQTQDDLRELLFVLCEMPLILLEQREIFKDSLCLGYRLRIRDVSSWISGFGNFDFLPKTRRAHFTEITVRVKTRPHYDWSMEEHPEGVVHLADMDMRGMSENQFKSLWYGSFHQTEKILGSKPDLRSAAKTTFAVPIGLFPEK